MVLRYDTRSRVSTYTQSWVSNADPDFGVFESIATVTLSTSTGSVTFSSIPQTYKHLQVRVLCKTDRPTYSIDEVYFHMNSDSGSNYAAHNLLGDGASATSAGVASLTQMRYGIFLPSTTTVHASMFGVAIIDILDYANTNKYKTVRSLHGYDTNNTATTYVGRATLSSGLWMSTAAITSFAMIPITGPNFVQYSQFALYGIKA
jgi:hypothetical protein